jgi:CRISPR-associated protein Cas5h
MDCIKFKLTASYGHLKRPETNNNPLTYSILHKTALVGFIGAVCGIERKDMRALYPTLCRGLKYSVSLDKPLIKETHAFTKRKVVRGNFYSPDRRYCELLKNVSYTVFVVCASDCAREIFNKFKDYLLKDLSVYKTYLGVTHCPMGYSEVQEGSVSDLKTGEYSSSFFFSPNHVFDYEGNDLCYDRIPSYQTEDFFNPPEHMVPIIFSPTCEKISITGDYYEASTGDRLWLL